MKVIKDERGLYVATEDNGKATFTEKRDKALQMGDGEAETKANLLAENYGHSFTIEQVN